MLDQLKTRIAPLLLCGVLLAVAFWWWAPGASPERGVSAPAGASFGSSQAPAVQGGGGTTAAKARDALEPDMMTTKLDPARLFDLGFAGGLTIDRDTRATLDALVMAMPQELSDADVEKLESALRAGLPKEDAEKAIQLFKGYRSYQADMKAELPQMALPETPETANAYFDRVAQVQRRHFDDATASALFSQDNLNARLVTQAAFINRNTSLSPSQKKDRLDALRAQLPLDQRDAIPEPEPEAPVVVEPQGKP